MHAAIIIIIIIIIIIVVVVVVVVIVVVVLWATGRDFSLSVYPSSTILQMTALMKPKYRDYHAQYQRYHRLHRHYI